jgi:hypothetical protein
MTAANPIAGRPQVSRETLQLVRTQVRDLLSRSEAFRKLPPDQQMQIANDTVRIGSYLAEPDGIPGNRLSTATPPAKGTDPYAFPLKAPQKLSKAQGQDPSKFTAQAAREGAAVAGVLLQQVNFSDFVGGLITKVFHAIVQSSIEQMEAYGRLVSDVAKTLNQFRDENTTDNQGRDQLVEQFPDVFKIDVDTGEDGNAQPRVRARDGVDEDSALKRINSSLPMDGGPLSSLDDDELEAKAVPAARTQLATSRQQLLATMVLMGINRIVVTDGRISAKVMYDFQAKDNFKYRNSATQFDYDPKLTTTSTQSSYESGSGGGSDSDSRDGSYYARGQYKSTTQPVLNLVSATQIANDAALTAKASLAGQVEVNFKSDYLPLEKMADSFQIGRIQDAAKPAQSQGRAAAPASGQQPPAASSPPPAAPAQAAPRA